MLPLTIGWSVETMQEFKSVSWQRWPAVYSFRAVPRAIQSWRSVKECGGRAREARWRLLWRLVPHRKARQACAPTSCPFDLSFIECPLGVHRVSWAPRDFTLIDVAVHFLGLRLHMMDLEVMSSDKNFIAVWWRTVGRKWVWSWTLEYVIYPDHVLSRPQGISQPHHISSVYSRNHTESRMVSFHHGFQWGVLERVYKEVPPQI